MGTAPILITRMRYRGDHPYDPILRYWGAEHRDAAKLIQLEYAGYELPSDAQTQLHLPWIQDPLNEYNPEAFKRALEFERTCDERGITTYNRVSAHPFAAKVEMSNRLRAAGVRCARSVHVDDLERFRDDLYGLQLPVILRDDNVHTMDFVILESTEEARRADLSAFPSPILTEFIDVRSPDGYYRKYRTMLIGEDSAPRHMQWSTGPITRMKNRVLNPLSREEEIAFTCVEDSRAEELQVAKRALGIDFAGVDYGIDREGNTIIWELNFFPSFLWDSPNLEYCKPAMQRIMARMLRWYLQTIGEPISNRLERHCRIEDL